MIYVSNVIFNQHYFSIQAITAALNGIPHVYVELLPLAQVQRMGSGSDSIWGQKKLLEPVCCMSNIFSVFHSSSTDSTCRQNKLLEPVCCMSNIFSVFHSSSTDSTCRQNKLLEPVCCMSNIFNFPQQQYRFNLQAKQTVGTCLLHVKYFQFSTVAVQIQPAGKNNCWNLFVACQIFSIFHSSSTDSTGRQKQLVEPVCCMSNIFSFFHSSSTDSTCRQKQLVEPVCCMSNILNFPQ